MQQWGEREALLREEAGRDLEAGDEVRPCFLAMAGDHPLFLAFSRPFDKGGHLDALIELMALAAPLDADRLAVSLGGRAWSYHDPIPPVLPGVGDLRQPVLVIEEADGSRGRTRARSSAFPMDLADGRVRWGEPLRADDTGSPVSTALALTIRRRRALQGSDAEIRGHIERCVRRGHLIALSEPLHARLTR